MNNEKMDKYEVKYHTTPSPGLTFYQGTVEVFADDDHNAEKRAVRELCRNGNWWPSLIVITEVTRKR